MLTLPPRALLVSAVLLNLSLRPSSQADVYKAAAPATVLIKTDRGGGSGFIVSPTGLVATSLHVIDGARAVTIKLISGEIYDTVSLVAKDDRKDIALLQIPAVDLPVIELANSNELNPGDRIIVIGNPFASEKLQTSMSDGIVAGIRDFDWGYKVIQLTAPISPGNSGGPVLSAKGKAVGIAALKLVGGENLNFAIPINYVRGMLNSVDSNKPIARWDAGRLTQAASNEHRASRLAEVHSISVGDLGQSEGARMIREKVINRLAMSGRLTVVEYSGDGDAELIGMVERSEIPGDCDASVALRVIGKDGHILWSGESKWNGRGSFSSSLAERVTDKLLEAIRKEEKGGASKH